MSVAPAFVGYNCCSPFLRDTEGHCVSRGANSGAESGLAAVSLFLAGSAWVCTLGDCALIGDCVPPGGGQQKRTYLRARGGHGCECARAGVVESIIIPVCPSEKWFGTQQRKFIEYRST